MLDWYHLKYKEKPKKQKTPLEPNDHPELDSSKEVEFDQIKEVQSMVGQFQWLVSLGRFDIFSAVTTLSRFRVQPREGHVDRCKGLFGYLAEKPEAGIRYRTEEPDFSGLPSQVFDWTRSVYGDGREQVPKDAPLPRGRYVVTSTYVDANLFHDHINGRALTAVLHLVNGTPIDWYCKRQATVEAATYGSEFVAARTAVDQIVDLKNTMRYFGVPIWENIYVWR